MQIARPHPLLMNHLSNAGFEWCSVLNIDDWQSLWDKNAPPGELEKDLAFFKEWLKNGHHAGMNFLANNMPARENARLILPNVGAVLSLVVPYATGQIIRASKNSNEDIQRQKNISDIDKTDSIWRFTARYARVSDYHKAIRKELDNALMHWQKDAIDKGIISKAKNWRVATDSLPFLDRAHARIAGLGFIGKNTMLIRPGIGSYFFIAHVLIEAHFSELNDPQNEKPLGADAMGQLSCGDCTRCIDACPTQALIGPRQLDSNKCLSYLSIENRDVVPKEFIKHFAQQFYGCDICQDVCPYNLKTISLTTISPFKKTLPILQEITLKDVALMNKDQYEKWFGGSAMTRAKYSGLVRNALYSMHANQHSELGSVLKARVQDPEPLIRKTVAQLSQLSTN